MSLEAVDAGAPLSAQSGPTAPVTPLPATTPTHTALQANGALNIGAGEWLYFSDTDYIIYGSAHLGVSAADAAPSFVNAGKITAIGTQSVVVMGVGVTGQRSWDAPVSVTNAATGAIYTHATGTYGIATGLYLGSPVKVQNAGLIQVVADNGRATGLVCIDVGEVNNTASGVIKVWGEGNGLGISFVVGGTVNNAGLIDVYGGTDVLSSGAIGVWDAVFLNNSGTIRATATTDIGVSVAVLMDHGVSSFVNSGTIQGDYAFFSTVDSPGGHQTLNNSGWMIGVVETGVMSTTLVNTGVIDGPVFFGEQDDTYEGVGGLLWGPLYLGAGTNVARLGDEGETVICEAGVNTVTGGAGDDYIVVIAGANTIDGGGGFNVVSFESAASAVAVNLATGVVTGPSATTLSHVQAAVGSDFNDVLVGGAGDDMLWGGLGDDQLNGGAGFDAALYLDAASGVYVNLNILTAQNTGGGGVDTLVSIEDLLGSDYADVLVGDGQANYLYGENGDDLLLGGLGDDMLDGGDGVDTASYLSITSGVTVSLAQPNAQSTGAAGVDILASIENLIGTAFGDTLYGDDGANRLEGNAGNDGLAGGAGDDVLDGGTEADYMVGGTGNDSYIIDNFYDTIIEAAGEGVDVVYASTSYGLGANVEVLYLGAASDSNGVGNALGNTLVGDAHNNYLSGLAGDDALLGGDGADHEYGGDGADYLNGQGGDDWLVGDDGFDRLYGEAGVDVLIGGAGVDLMVGGLGDDGYVVDNGGDLIVENAGEGTEAVYAFANYTLADNVENLWLFDAATSGGGNAGDNLLVANVDVGSTLYGLAGADALVGENGADVLYGGADNDFLNGQAGADTLVGGQGSDYLYGGAGADTFLYTAASDSIGAAGAMDAILDFEIGVDKVNLHGVLGGAGDSVSLLTNSDGTYILVDLGGDGSEDMRILLYHTTGVTMSDLVL